MWQRERAFCCNRAQLQIIKKNKTISCNFNRLLFVFYIQCRRRKTSEKLVAAPRHAYMPLMHAQWLLSVHVFCLYECNLWFLNPVQAWLLDTVFPETIVSPGSLPELLPDAQHVAERIKEDLGDGIRLVIRAVWWLVVQVYGSGRTYLFFHTPGKQPRCSRAWQERKHNSISDSCRARCL